MRGYLSFLLVFASVFIIAFFASAMAKASDFSFEKTLLIERYYALQMNVKEAIIESVRQGAAAGFDAYLSTIIISGEEYDPQAAEAAARAGAFANLMKLQQHSFDDDSEVLLWCGYVNERELERVRDEMQQQKRALLCDGCLLLHSPACLEFVKVKINVSGGELMLYDSTVPLKRGVVGVSIYSKKFGYSSVSYIPQNERIAFGG